MCWCRIPKEAKEPSIACFDLGFRLRAQAHYQSLVCWPWARLGSILGTIFNLVLLLTEHKRFTTYDDCISIMSSSKQIFSKSIES